MKRKIFIMVALFLSMAGQTKATDYVIISEVLYDTPPFNPYTDQNGIALYSYPKNYGQFIELYNAGSASVNLSGWKLETQIVGNESYTFPAGTVLAPGAFLIVAYGEPYLDVPVEKRFEEFDVFETFFHALNQLDPQTKLVLFQTDMPLFRPSHTNPQAQPKMERLALLDLNKNVKDKLDYGWTYAYQVTASNSDCPNCCGLGLRSLQRQSFFFDSNGNAIFPYEGCHWVSDPQYQLCTPFRNVTNYMEMSYWNDPNSLGRNYIVSATPLIEMASIPEVNKRMKLDSLKNVGIKVDYFDGLGRPLQTMHKAFTPLGKNLISRTDYDIYGRLKKEWLPVAVDADFLGADQFAFSSTELYTDTRAYTEYKYSTDTLTGKVLKDELIGIQAPGNDMNNKYAARKTLPNEANTVKFYRIVNDTTLQMKGYYPSKTLLYEQTTDEDGKVARTYKNKQDQVVMTRQINGSANHDTYYVYNDLGQLCYMLPPLASDAMSTVNTNYSDSYDAMKKYCYLYKYDSRGNQIESRLPGCSSVYMVYDKANRLVATQDGNQWKKNKWTVNRYDAFGRLLYSFITVNTKINIDNAFANNTIHESYTGNSLTGGYSLSTNNVSVSIASMLSVNYYDNYNFLSLLSPTSVADSLAYQTKSGYGVKCANTKSLLTGTRVYHLDEPAKYETTAIYYDTREQVIQTHSANHLKGYNHIYNKLSFTGNPLKTLKQQVVVACPGGYVPLKATTTELYEYTYDHADRLLTTTYTVNNKPPVMLADNTYDELGRLIKKKRHSNADTEQFAYNVRSWLTKITSGSFVQNLYYNANFPPAAATAATPCYNGNISATTWTYNGATNGYLYYYDGLNRLTGNYSILNNVFYDCGEYSETFSYDKHGNIKYLNRFNSMELDLLTLTYNGNQLQTVYDDWPNSNQYNVKEYKYKGPNSTKFTYDVNGNMISDFDRDIVTIRYNLLNLPDTIQFKNGNQIINKYGATGKKLETKYFTRLLPLAMPLSVGETRQWTYELDIIDLHGTSYVDNIEYDIDGTNYGDYMLNRVHNPEGYVMYPSSAPRYHYYRKDHLGNNREVWRADNNTTIQRTQYYPSGLPWQEGLSPSTQPYKHQGKEFIEMHGYDVTDHGNRGIHHASNRYTTMDRFCENFPWQSPYCHAANNPVRYVDINGDSIPVTTKKGEYLFTLDDGKTENTTLTAQEVYNRGIQWFASDADNYMPMVKKADNLSSHSGILHFTSEQIMEFAEKDRSMTSYRKDGEGDWKKSKEGADGYLLVTVDGKLYWADAIGQIPFTINNYRNVLEKTQSSFQAQEQTIKAGKKHGDGGLFFPKPDNTNSYDNSIIKRTVTWAANYYHLELQNGKWTMVRNTSNDARPFNARPLFHFK